MRKICIFLSCLTTIPAVALDDACTKPGEFTIDRRCYVTDEQKTKKPFNATVALLDNNKPYCTGTIVKYEDKLYVYTANHCAKDGNSITIRLQNGQEYNITQLRNGGNKDDRFHTQDWALYTMESTTELIPYTQISDKFELNTKRYEEIKEQSFPGIYAEYKDKLNATGRYDSEEANKLAKSIATYEAEDIAEKQSADEFNAKVLGYGALKIMSNTDIAEFKQKYIEYLKSNDYNLDISDEGIGTNRIGEAFILHYINDDYYDRLFNDVDNLKVSYCTAVRKYNQISLKNCQGWGGNSGGGVFDVNENLAAIVSTGLSIISGTDHAALRDASPFETPNKN